MAKSVYIAAAAATVAVVLLIFLSVTVSDNERLGQISDETRLIPLQSELQAAYSDFDQNNLGVYCTVINNGIELNSQSLLQLNDRLQSFKSDSFNTQQFFIVKKTYLLTSMILLQDIEKAKKSCDLKLKTVLFFYSEDGSCGASCDLVGSQLWNLQADCNSFRLFNFPFNWPAYDFTRLLEVKYGVARAGTVVVDGEKIDSVQPMEFWKKKLGCE